MLTLRLDLCPAARADPVPAPALPRDVVAERACEDLTAPRLPPGALVPAVPVVPEATLGVPTLLPVAGLASLAEATWLRTVLPLAEASLSRYLAWFCATLDVTFRLG